MVSRNGDRADELMTDHETKAEQIGHLVATLDATGGLENDRFKLFLDQMPIAIAVAEMQPAERIIYTNLSFEQLTETPVVDIIGRSWNLFDGSGNEPRLSLAVTGGQDIHGIFSIGSGAKSVNVWSNVIEDEEGVPKFRLVALATMDNTNETERAELIQALQQKDTLLREIQHRVKNNLQMITALIRMEARKLPEEGVTFDRLAGRVEALALLYQSLSEHGVTEEIDLGVYLSQIASALMRAQAVEGIRLDLKVDTWPVSINVAMPTGLVVNELLMNALKHGFKDREGGTITLHSLVDETGCRVVIADDGSGLSDGEEWPKRGKLSYLILQSLRENAKAQVDVQSRPGSGMRVTITFAREAAAADLQTIDPAGA
jgi:two-component sensor histidine kinase